MDLENQRVEILKNSYERLKKQNAAFSVRALARKMNLTPAFISKVFNNKTPLPFERVDEFAHHLKMDKTAKNALIRTYDNEKNRKLRGADNSNEKLDPIINTYKILPERSETLLSNWYNLAILELSFSKDFKDDAIEISDRLGITVDQAKTSLHFLKANGLLVERDGKWCKMEKNVRLPTTTSKSIVRDFHRQMLKKAENELNRKTGQTEFDARLIAGVTISTNPENISRAIDRYNEMMYEIADILHDEKATEVYYIGSLVFPLTKIEKK